MDFSAPETAPILLWTLMRGAALAVLAAATTGSRLSDAAQAAARLFWAATPAVLLAGLALWCLASITGSAAAVPAVAQFVPR